MSGGASVGLRFWAGQRVGRLAPYPINNGSRHSPVPCAMSEASPAIFWARSDNTIEICVGDRKMCWTVCHNSGHAVARHSALISSTACASIFAIQFLFSETINQTSKLQLCGQTSHKVLFKPVNSNYADKNCIISLPFDMLYYIDLFIDIYLLDVNVYIYIYQYICFPRLKYIYILK